MDDDNLVAWLALSFIPKLGGRKLTKLMMLDSPANLVNYSTQQLLMIGLSQEQIVYLQQRAIKEADHCLAWQHKDFDHHIVTMQSEDYPPLLKEIASAPPVLFVKGNLTTLSKPQIAIVGSRNASQDGRWAAYQFSQNFVHHNLVVTSGLALGIDGFAHDSALNANGETVAVLGSGLDVIYPARHTNLAERIRSSGALVSEFRPDAKPRPEHFPRRNRIISGLSMGVLIIEAAEKSGSLITARYAIEQSRDVFVVPGAINNLNCSGSNQLIRTGACLVQSAEQVLEEIGTLIDWTVSQLRHKPKENITQPCLFDIIPNGQELPYAQLLANIGVDVTSVDMIASQSNMPVHEAMMQLLELELRGVIIAVSGGYIRKRNN